MTLMHCIQRGAGEEQEGRKSGDLMMFSTLGLQTVKLSGAQFKSLAMIRCEPLPVHLNPPQSDYIHTLRL